MVVAPLVLTLLPGPPKSVGILCKFTAFLGSLLWLVGTVDMGHFGVSFLEIPIFFLNTGPVTGCSVKKVTRPHIRPNRPISIPSAPVSEGAEI